MKITRIAPQVKRPDRYSVYIDGAYSFSLSESALIAEQLASGQEVDAARLQALKQAAGADKAYGLAVRYVALRPRSEWEVQSYLQRKEVDEPVVQQTMERLRVLGLLDDRAFAAMWVDNRRLLLHVSSKRLYAELQRKRVPRQVIADVLALQDTSADDRTALLQLVQKKRSRYPDRTKFMQYLARQGFRYDDIVAALDNLEIK